MVRVAWLTDTHLDFANQTFRTQLGSKVLAENPDVVVITGDIATSTTIRELLREFRKNVGVPVYFVLGNHDLWGARIGITYNVVRNLTTKTLVWLHEAGVVSLSPTTALVGMDGWYDLRAGDVYSSEFRMHDMTAVHDFQNLGKDSTLAMVMRMADQSSYRLIDKAEAAIEQGHRHILLATHVPPFQEVCLYRNRPTGVHQLPYYCNLRLGELLQGMAEDHPDIQFTMLCGHTHGAMDYQHPVGNLRVLAGGVTPTEPRLQQVLVVE